MADYIVKDTELTGVANSIRTAGSTSSLLTFPNGFISAINNIGGGGGGDLSTANVTVTLNTPTYIVAGFCVDDGEFPGLFPMIQQSGDYKIALYKSKSIVLDLGALMGQPHTITVTGNATVLETGMVLVTGDCTITVG